jgi:hypothetical protein
MSVAFKKIVCEPRALVLTPSVPRASTVMMHSPTGTIGPPCPMVI